VPASFVNSHKIAAVSNEVNWATALTFVSIDIVEKSSVDDAIEDVGMV
jgi:hypothetical protein